MRRRVTLILQGVWLIVCLAFFVPLLAKSPGVLLIFAAFFGTGFLLFKLVEQGPKRQGYDKKCRPPTLSPSHIFQPDAFTITGGCRIGKFNATIPLAELTCDSAWVQIRTKRMLGVLTPTQLAPPPVWIPRSDFTRVTMLRGLMTAGVLLRTTSGDFDGVIFWHLRPSVVNAGLEQHGWRDRPPREKSPAENTLR